MRLWETVITLAEILLLHLRGHYTCGKTFLHLQEHYACRKTLLHLWLLITISQITTLLGLIDSNSGWMPFNAPFVRSIWLSKKLYQKLHKCQQNQHVNQLLGKRLDICISFLASEAVMFITCN